MLNAAIETLVSTLETATGQRVTADPAKFVAPSIVIEPPTITGATAGAWTLELPICIVSPAPSDARAREWILDVVPDVLNALGERSATPSVYSPNGSQTFPCYRVTATLTVRRTA